MRITLCVLILLIHMSAAPCTLSAAHAPNADYQRQIKADALLRELEADILHITTLSADKRYRKEVQLGSRISRLERSIRGTKANNKVLYILANWQVIYDIDAAWTTIEQLSHSTYLPHKRTLDLVKIRFHLKKGDTVQARVLAESISADMPEFASMLDLVRLYEKRGDPAPTHITPPDSDTTRRAGSGKHLNGPYAHPLADAPHPFIVYIFAELNDDWQAFHIKALCTELQRSAYQEKIHVVCVSFDGKYIQALSTWQDLSIDQPWDLFWANPSKKGDAVHWKAAWGTYTTPTYILVGPQRDILEINPSIAELRILAGIKKTTSKSTKKGKRSRRKGRRW